ncbi:hypothetical protein CL689_03915 [Candidatus Saccharibacteria bacterium]|nr:hypothetical protein [Candidatus Saccharibacteria bacterium]|tara:strand:+ start:409 stop:705 length:297 start_codon:yes stop_codon:yes gene_type:complete
MVFRSLFAKKDESSAGHAKERLQLMISTQRMNIGDARGSQAALDPKLLYKIQAEIMLVLEKYVSINRDDLEVEIRKIDEHTEVLEVSIPIGGDRLIVG